MIHVVHSGNRHLYARELDEMFVQRRIIFFERAGWTDLTIVDGKEIDDFDDDRAVYLLALNDEGALYGAVRTRPTEDRCILADKYAELIGPGCPPMKGPDVWESTRIFTTKAYRETRESGARLFHALALAAKEYAHAHGCRRMIGMCDVQMLPHITDGPVEVHLAGLPSPYAFGVMIGTWVHCTEAVIVRSRDSLALQGPISYEVTGNDVRRHGSVIAVQRAVDAERRGEPVPATFEADVGKPVPSAPAIADASIQTSGAVS